MRTLKDHRRTVQQIEARTLLARGEEMRACGGSTTRITRDCYRLFHAKAFSAWLASGGPGVLPSQILGTARAPAEGGAPTSIQNWVVVLWATTKTRPPMAPFTSCASGFGR